MGHFLGAMYPFLAQHYTVSLFCHPDISPHTKFWSFQTIWEGWVCMYMHVCVCACFSACIFLNHLSSLVHKAWGLSLVSFLHRREVAQSHFQVCPSFPFVILQASSSNCLSHPLALSFTALHSVLIPVPFIHLLFPLNMCLIALLLTPPPH